MEQPGVEGKYFVPFRWAIGKLTVGPNAWNDQLILVDPGGNNDGVYEPAQAVHINGREEVLQLLDTLKKAYPQ